MKKLSFKLQFFSYFNLRPKFKAAQEKFEALRIRIRKFLRIPEKPETEPDSLSAPLTADRLVLRAGMTLVISVLSMLTAGTLLSYPGGIVTLIAQFLVLANQSLGGMVPFQQLLGAFGGGLIFMIDLTILFFYASASEPIQVSDISEQLLEFDSVIAQRFEIVHCTLDNKIIPMLRKDGDEDDADVLVRLTTTDPHS